MRDLRGQPGGTGRRGTRWPEAGDPQPPDLSPEVEQRVTHFPWRGGAVQAQCQWRLLLCPSVPGSLRLRARTGVSVFMSLSLLWAMDAPGAAVGILAEMKPGGWHSGCAQKRL